MEPIELTAREYVDGEVRHLRELLEARFDGLDARIDGAVDGLNAKMDGLDAKMDGMSAKMDGMSAKFDGMSAKMDAMLALYAPLADEVRRLHEELDVIRDVVSRKDPLGFPRRDPPPAT